MLTLKERAKRIALRDIRQDLKSQPKEKPLKPFNRTTEGKQGVYSLYDYFNGKYIETYSYEREIILKRLEYRDAAKQGYILTHQ